MSIETRPRALTNDYELIAFAPGDAQQVASWVRSDAEAYWLAPRTPAPLSAPKVLEWTRDAGDACLLRERARGALAGYGEVNPLGGRRGEFWLGHLVVASEMRGRGVGRVLTELLLRRAFRTHGARRVTLVVFPENASAIACYRRAGMSFDGVEEHYFPQTGEAVSMIRMAALRGVETGR